MSTTTKADMDEKTGPFGDWEAWRDSFINETFTTMQRMASVPFLPSKVERIRKGVTPREVVYEEDRLKLYHYIGSEPPKYKTPLCFVFALVNRPYIVDLKEGRSVVANFVN